MVSSPSLVSPPLSYYPFPPPTWIVKFNAFLGGEESLGCGGGFRKRAKRARASSEVNVAPPPPPAPSVPPKS